MSFLLWCCYLLNSAVNCPSMKTLYKYVVTNPSVEYYLNKKKNHLYFCFAFLKSSHLTAHISLFDNIPYIKESSPSRVHLPFKLGLLPQSQPQNDGQKPSPGMRGPKPKTQRPQESRPHTADLLTWLVDQFTYQEPYVNCAEYKSS